MKPKDNKFYKEREKKELNDIINEISNDKRREGIIRETKAKHNKALVRDEKVNVRKVERGNEKQAYTPKLKGKGLPVATYPHELLASDPEMLLAENENIYGKDMEAGEGLNSVSESSIKKPTASHEVDKPVEDNLSKPLSKAIEQVKFDLENMHISRREIDNLCWEGLHIEEIILMGIRKGIVLGYKEGVEDGAIGFVDKKRL